MITINTNVHVGIAGFESPTVSFRENLLSFLKAEYIIPLPVAVSCKISLFLGIVSFWVDSFGDVVSAVEANINTRCCLTPLAKQIVPPPKET